MNYQALHQEATRLGIRFDPEISLSALARRIQVRLGHEPCCGTDERYFCKERACRWWGACHQKIAEWRR